MPIVRDFELMPWEMEDGGYSYTLCGIGPLDLLLNTGEHVTVRAALGPGYWHRIHEELKKLGIEPGVLPHADGTINWEGK